jgi:hypothetical protein
MEDLIEEVRKGMIALIAKVVLADSLEYLHILGEFGFVSDVFFVAR